METAQTILIDPRDTLDEAEKKIIFKQLELNQNNRTLTAKTLKIGIRMLQRKLIRYKKEQNELVQTNRP